MAGIPKIRGLSGILTYFRRNETPIFFVSPTAFNLLGVEKFINRFYHINYFDSFDGMHPRVFVPEEKSHAEFDSMEDVMDWRYQYHWVGVKDSARASEFRLYCVTCSNLPATSRKPAN